MARSSDTEDGGLTQEQHVLRDLLRPNMVTVFCGDAAGRRSAKKQEYYADSRNRFWEVLWKIKLTRQQFKPCEYPKLAKLRIGLTDLNKIGLSGDSESLYDVEGLYQKIKKYRPRILVFAGEKPAQVFLKVKFGGKVKKYGLQPEHHWLGRTKLFVLPSTSRRNPRWESECWGPRYWECWRGLAERHRKLLKK